ncbi:MAG: hypoxanthine-guanine phosphoribosyltransferase [Burkholderiales bacterium]|nr:hypoxanthine-guanine phosphoribosyltransferase [Burkholderiales bacterium]
MFTPEEAWQVLRSAECIVSADAIDAALARLAGDISARLAGANPLVVTVMGGAVVFSGRLLPMLHFPLEFDFVHVTRYGDATRGGRLDWKVKPRTPVAGRTVLVLDDILDEGITLAAIREGLLADGAQAVQCAVFADKDLGRGKPIAADFVGLRLPDRYVFGFGMDVRGAWRNLPEIYALKG